MSSRHALGLVVVGHNRNRQRVQDCKDWVNSFEKDLFNPATVAVLSAVRGLRDHWLASSRRAMGGDSSEGIASLDFGAAYSGKLKQEARQYFSVSGWRRPSPPDGIPVAVSR